jgi:hypothetical protein
VLSLCRRVSVIPSRVLGSFFIPAITLSIVLRCFFPGPACAEQPNSPAQPARAQEGSSKAAEEESLWQYGAYLDVSYGLDFNFPENHQFRSRGTTPRTNELAPNMALGYVRKLATAESRWGMELGGQGGYDTRNFAYGQDRPHVGGGDTLRHIAYANVSYLAPNGMTVLAGLFDSLIGYESLYAVKNLNYSRSWIADNSPYKMFGIYARYPIRNDLTVGAAVLNGYWHLAHPNNQPSYLGQVSWKASHRLTITENVYYGPDQRQTSLEFWRVFSNFIVGWEGDDLTVAFSYDLGTENIAADPNHPRTFWTGAALFTRWHIDGPWSVAARPELYWDQDGRQTGFEQFVKAITTTVEYKVPLKANHVVLRLEHRYDESTGAQGGFFKGGDIAPGRPGLARDQHLLFFAAMWTFDSLR